MAPTLLVFCKALKPGLVPEPGWLNEPRAQLPCCAAVAKEPGLGVYLFWMFLLYYDVLRLLISTYFLNCKLSRVID